MESKQFCEIYFIRHGETTWNALGLLQGQLDSPLNETGEKQAEDLGRTLAPIAFDAIISSDSSRASRTAEIVRGPRQITIQTTTALRERCMQDWERHEIKELNAYIERNGDPFAGLSKEAYLAYRLPNRIEQTASQVETVREVLKAEQPATPTETHKYSQIETHNEVYQRVADFFKTQITTSYLGKKVLASSHGGLMRSLLYKLEEWHPELFWSVPNCSYLVLRAYEDGSIQIVSKNAPSPTGKGPELTTKTSSRW